MFYDGAVFQLRNSRRDRYDAFDFSIRRTFAGAVMSGSWDIRGRARGSMRRWITAWKTRCSRRRCRGRLPGTLRTASTCGAGRRCRTACCRTAWISSAATPRRRTWWSTAPAFRSASWIEEGFWWARPNSPRYPDYFNINLHLERQFRALHYLWAWRFGYNNLTGNLNPNVVDNVDGLAEVPDLRRRAGARIQRTAAAAGTEVGPHAAGIRQTRTRVNWKWKVTIHMASPPIPPQLDHLITRPFSFYPPIIGIEHNEWLYRKASWSEILVVNCKSGEEIWISRRYIGEVSRVDDPV